jgi:hypothetical protein
MKPRARLDVANLEIDLAERLRQALHALREGESRLRDIIQLSSDRYWEQDEHFRFVAHPGGAGDSSDDELGKTLWELPVLGVTEAQWRAHQDGLPRTDPFAIFPTSAATTRGSRATSAPAGGRCSTRQASFAVTGVSREM